MLSMGIRAPAPATYDRSALFPKHEHGTWSESTHQMQIISIREMMGLSIDAVEMEIDDRPVIVLSFLDIGMPFSMMSPDMPGNTASGRLLGRFSYDAVHVTLPADRGAIYGIRLKNQKISLPPPKPKERFVPENAPLIEATAAENGGHAGGGGNSTAWDLTMGNEQQMLEKELYSPGNSFYCRGGNRGVALADSVWFEGG